MIYLFVISSRKKLLLLKGTQHLFILSLLSRAHYILWPAISHGSSRKKMFIDALSKKSKQKSSIITELSSSLVCATRELQYFHRLCYSAANIGKYVPGTFFSEFFLCANLFWVNLFQVIPKSTRKYQKVPKNTKNYPKILKSTKKYQKVPKSTKKYYNIPKNTKNYQKLPKST